MKCTYCKRETIKRPHWYAAPAEQRGLQLTRDHVVPRSRGGLDVAANCVPACYRCNSLKGNMMPDEWEQYMRDNPCWWWAGTTSKPALDKPVAVKAPPSALNSMTAIENARRIKEYLARQAPVESTDEADAKYLLTYGKKRFKIWVSKGRPTPPYDLRQLKKGEPIPIEYDDPMKQRAFELAYRGREYLLFVPKDAPLHSP